MPSPELSSASWKWKLLALGILAIAAFIWRDALIDLLQNLLDTVESLGAWGPILFVLVYALATVALVPGSLLTLFAGASFGVLWGSLWTSLGATLGATLAFLVGRHWARAWVARQIEGNEKFEAVDRAVAQDGWKIVGLTRLSPVFPFTLLNYAFGLTRVRLREYVLASWIGMIPGTILYNYVGSLGKTVRASSSRTTGEWIFFGVGLAATILVTILITRKARRILRSKL